MPHFSGDSVVAESVVLSGTNPIQITSTAKITNLNAEYLNGQPSTYYLNVANMTGILPYTSFNDSSHGSRIGGTLHAAATTSAAGFMSPSDKQKLDSITPGANVSGNAYTNLTDGTNAAAAQVATDTIRFRTNNSAILDITVGSNDPSYGDNVLFSIDIQEIVDTVLAVTAHKLTVRTISTASQINSWDIIVPDTSSLGFTCIPPANPSQGDTFYILGNENLSKNALTLSSATYNSTTDTFVCQTDNVEYKFIYINSTIGWKVFIR